MAADDQTAGTDRDEIVVGLEWRPLGAMRLTGEGLRLPDAPQGGGLYRFRLSLGERRRIYVGETAVYSRRFHQYANPGSTQRTNLRMRDRPFTLLAEHGGEAALDVAPVPEVKVNGVPLALPPYAISVEFVRRLGENAALIAALHDGAHLVNGRGYPPAEVWEPWATR